MNLSKILFLAFVLLSFSSFAQQDGRPSYSSTSCDGMIFLQNPQVIDSCRWYTEDTLTLLGTDVDTVMNLCPGNYLCHAYNGNWYWTYATVYDRDSCRQYGPMLNWGVPSSGTACDGTMEVYEQSLFLEAPPYTFLWNTGDTVRSLGSNNCIGTYWCIVTDGFGCVDSLGYDLYAWCPGVSGQYNQYEIPTGYYNWDGEFLHSVSGMTPPYTRQINRYNIFNHPQLDTSWTLPPSNSDSIFLDSLAAGFYIVKVVDADGCFVENGVDLGDTLLYSGCGDFQIYANTTNESSTGACDGEALVFSTGYDGIVSYHWLDIQGDTISTSDQVSNLCPDYYVVHAYDQNNCYQNYVVYVGDSNSISIDYYIVNEATDAYTCDAEYLFFVNGGTPPYTVYHNISGDSNTYVQSNLCPGIHNIAVWDSQNSHQNLNYLVVANDKLFAPTGANPVDTIHAAPIEDCAVDFDNIDNAYVFDYTVVDSLITAEWVINYTDGSSYALEVEYVAWIDTTLEYAFTISLYCTALKSADERIKIYSDLSGTPLGLTTNEKIEFNIYPNPSNGDFNIQSNLEGDYKVYSLTGKIIKTGTIEEGDNKIKLNHKGVFLIHFQTDKGVLVRRVISQ